MKKFLSIVVSVLFMFSFTGICYAKQDKSNNAADPSVKKRGSSLG